MAIAPALCSSPSRLSIVTGYCPGLISTLAFWLALTLPSGSDREGQVALAASLICLLQSVFSRSWQSHMSHPT